MEIQETNESGTNCKDCERYKSLGEVCVIEHGKKFLWEFCRDFQPEVKLPDYDDLMRTVKKEIAAEREKVRQKKKRERALRHKELGQKRSLSRSPEKKTKRKNTKNDEDSVQKPKVPRKSAPVTLDTVPRNEKPPTKGQKKIVNPKRGKEKPAGDQKRLSFEAPVNPPPKRSASKTRSPRKSVET